MNPNRIDSTTGTRIDVTPDVNVDVVPISPDVAPVPPPPPAPPNNTDTVVQCIHSVGDLTQKVYAAYIKQIRANSLLADLVYSILSNYRRSMGDIAPLDSDCEKAFGVFETEAYNYLRAAQSNMGAINNGLIDAIRQVDCKNDPDWQSKVTALTDMVNAVTATADSDYAAAFEIQEKLYQWCVNCLGDSGYSMPKYDPDIWERPL